jgi:hypothetical protein
MLVCKLRESFEHIVVAADERALTAPRSARALANVAFDLEYPIRIVEGSTDLPNLKRSKLGDHHSRSPRYKVWRSSRQFLLGTSHPHDSQRICFTSPTGTRKRHPTRLPDVEMVGIPTLPSPQSGQS